MKLYLKNYTILYTEIQIDDRETYDNVVDVLCEYTRQPYSFRFEITGKAFKDAVYSGDIRIMGRDAQLVIERATAAVDIKGADMLVFKSVMEVQG